MFLLSNESIFGAARVTNKWAAEQGRHTGLDEEGQGRHRC